MRVSKRIVAEQFVPTSTTPPSDVGIYKVDRTTLGVAGTIQTINPATKAVSNVLLQSELSDQLYSLGSGRVMSYGVTFPRVIAALVTSSTADQTGNTVTVTATAHGISSAVAGADFYFPGSPSIPAGWYANLQRPTVNSLTFTNPVSQTVSSESVNSGAAFTGNAVIGSISIPPLTASGQVIADAFRSGGTTAASKQVQWNHGGSLIMKPPASTSSPFVRSQNSFANVGDTNKQVGYATIDGNATTGSGVYIGAVNTSVPSLLEFIGSVSAAGDFLLIYSAHVVVFP